MTADYNTPSNAGRHVSHLLAVADEIGCGLVQISEKDARLRGRCPFHKQRGARSETLLVNPEDGHFQCRACNIKGNPGTFMAMIWGVAATEAHEMLESMDGQVATTRRPAPMAMREPEKTLDPKFRRQNTHLLTAAARHFREGLRDHDPAARYIRKLGITTYNARRVRLGATGHPKLIEALRETGCTTNEIRQSPLIRVGKAGRQECAFYEAIAIPDTDIIGATKWMTMVKARPEEALLEQPPAPALALPGRRPYLLGMAPIPNETPRLVATDDARIYMILLTNGITACYTLSRKDGKRIAQRLTAKRARKTELIMWDQSLAEEIASNMRNAGRGRNITEWNETEVSRLIDPNKRDLSRLMRREGRAAPELPG